MFHNTLEQNSKNKMRVSYKVCPLCSSDKIEKSHIGDCSEHPLYKNEISCKIQWMNCKNCNHQFVNGYFNDEALSLIFSNTNDNQKVGFQIEQQRKISSEIVEKILPFKNLGNWLDIGFGNGSLLFTAQEYGFKTVGVDLRKDNVDIMKNIGFEVYCDLVENINFFKFFDVVSLMDILEHVPFPKSTLKTIASIMKKKACLIMSMPNTESIIWDLMNENNQNPYLNELEHYHNFSKTTIYRLLNECGIKPIKYGISKRYRACMEIIGLKI